VKQIFPLVPINAILVNVGLILTFWLRYGTIPSRNFAPYKESWVLLTVLYVATLAICGAYRYRFRSSWELFTKVTLGVLCGAIAGILLMYVFREKWGAFPTGIFVVTCPIHILLVFKMNQWILRKQKRIKKHVIVIGNGNIKGLVGKSSAYRTTPDEFKRLETNFDTIDRIIISERIENVAFAEYLALITHRFGIDLVYTPVVYMKLISGQINGNEHYANLKTFEGKRRDAEEFFIRLIDVAAASAGLVLLFPVLAIVAAGIKLTSRGPVIFKQERMGKDSTLFVLYKFRTMIQDAEKTTGPTLARKKDCRITRIGFFLRKFRIDELPQLWNILQGSMSLVGPRPERPFFVKKHKALQGIRLAVKPGLTGLAQIRGLYDLHPGHKLKYDYLYIQRRSLRLNLYILLSTFPALFKMRGW